MVVPPSPFGAHRGVPRAHSAFVPTRPYATSSLMSVESAPAMAQGVDMRVSGDGDSQGSDSPKKAGRLQHLKMRVAVSSFTSPASPPPLHPCSWPSLLEPSAANWPPLDPWPRFLTHAAASHSSQPWNTVCQALHCCCCCSHTCQLQTGVMSLTAYVRTVCSPCAYSHLRRAVPCFPCVAHIEPAGVHKQLCPCRRPVRL